MFRLTGLLLCLSLLFAQEFEIESSMIARKGVFENEPKALLFAFPEYLSIVYNQRTCGLIAAWEGTQKPRNKKDSLITSGEVLFHKQPAARWSLEQADTLLPLTCQFLEIVDKNGNKGIKYRLYLINGKQIEITEFPEFDNHYGEPSLYRSFTFKGIENGMTLTLPLSGGYVLENWFPAGGDGKIEGKPGHRYFRQRVDGASRIKVSWSKN